MVSRRTAVEEPEDNQKRENGVCGEPPGTEERRDEGGQHENPEQRVHPDQEGLLVVAQDVGRGVAEGVLDQMTEVRQPEEEVEAGEYEREDHWSEG